LVGKSRLRLPGPLQFSSQFSSYIWSHRELGSHPHWGLGGDLLGSGGGHGEEAVEAGHRGRGGRGGGQGCDDQPEGEDRHPQGGQGDQQHRGGPHVVKCFLVVAKQAYIAYKLRLTITAEVY